MSYDRGKFQSELARGKQALKELETKLSGIRSMISEHKSERGDIDGQRHVMERTGDINKVMALKTRSIVLDKSIAELSTAEQQCLERIESSRRYLEGLDSRLKKLKDEAASLSE